MEGGRKGGGGGKTEGERGAGERQGGRKGRKFIREGGRGRN